MVKLKLFFNIANNNKIYTAEYIGEISDNDFTSKEISGSMRFGGFTNLHNAFGSVDVLSAKVQGDYVDITLLDTYDFNKNDPNPLVKMGRRAQETGKLNPYFTIINYIAKTVRDYWDLGNEPVRDLVYQLEKSGIILTSLTATSKDIDAYSQKLKTKNGNKYLIVLTINKEKRVRRQFSCAHELGHIILHNWNEDLESVSKATFTELENQANKFASAFLLPKESFGKEVVKHPLALDYYIELKLKWNVSIAAMIIRARDLEIISYNQYQNLMRKYAYKGWKTCEPFDNELKTSNPTLLNSATKKILERKNWDGPTFINMFSEKYNICLPKDEIEELLHLDKDTLKFNEQAKVIELPFKD